MQIPAFYFFGKKRLTVNSTRAKIAQKLNSTCAKITTEMPKKELTWQEKI